MSDARRFHLAPAAPGFEPSGSTMYRGRGLKHADGYRCDGVRMLQPLVSTSGQGHADQWIRGTAKSARMARVMNVWSYAPSLDENTPAHRERYVDFLRAAAVLVVVFGHCLLQGPLYDGYRPDGRVHARSAGMNATGLCLCCLVPIRGSSIG